MSRAFPEPEENKEQVSSSALESAQMERMQSSYEADQQSRSAGSGTILPSSEGASRLSALLSRPQKKNRSPSPLTEQTGAVNEAEPSDDAGCGILTTVSTVSSVRTSSTKVANSDIAFEVHTKQNTLLENNSLSETNETPDLAPDYSIIQTSGESAPDHEATPPTREASPATGERAASSGGDLASFPAQNRSEQVPRQSGTFQNMELTAQFSKPMAPMVAAPQPASTRMKAPFEPPRQPQKASAFGPGPLAPAFPSSAQQNDISMPTLAPTLAPSPPSVSGAATTSLPSPNPVLPRAPPQAVPHGFAIGALAAANFAVATAPDSTRGVVVTPTRPSAPAAQPKTSARTVHVAPSSVAFPSSANPPVPVAPAGANVAGMPLAAAPRLNSPHSAGALAAAPALSNSMAVSLAPAPAPMSPPLSTPSTVVLVAPSAAALSFTSALGVPLVPNETTSSQAGAPPSARASPASTSSATSSTGHAGSSQTIGRWTREEHEAFLNGLKVFGREWKKVATRIPTRTSAQIRSHAQKYFARLAREERQHRAAAAAAAVAAQQPVGLAASSSSPGAGMGQTPVATGASPTNLPPSVMHNVERILADPAGVQREVERTLGALRERYRQLQERLDEQQRRHRLQAAAAMQQRPPQPPRGRDPRAGGKMLLALSAVAAGPQQHQPRRPGGDVSLSGRKRQAADVVVEIAAAPAAPAPAASVTAPAAPDASSSAGGSSSSCLEIRNAELIALQVLGGTLPRSGSRDPLNRPSPGVARSEGLSPGRGSPHSGGGIGAAAAEAVGSGGMAGSSSPSSVASINSSSEMKDDSKSDEHRSDPKRQRTSD
uniref:HTH myb-type domain-containing protein n=1 Tax=Odontella aurita TaxID=265563 RepID=A0A7S4I1T7_9STRA|mmetsp:Transcript_187/g.446  ORF Transcript_187/g.446 Transcript_187/m.446 type:complete len:831 (+) Transcript_187:197-2689(+)